MTDFFEVFTIWEGWVYLFILSILEIVLGIDNIIFISIVTDKLEESKKRLARNLGLSIALILRLLLLSLISLLMTLTTPLFSVLGSDISGQSMILILGGLFLIYKSVSEMHNSINHNPEESKKGKSTLTQIITQIVLIDLIFSFDSIISAVGMTNGIQEQTGKNPMAIIVIAIIISMVIMMLFSRQISQFISSNPTIKMIALSFLVAVGVLLIAEGFGQEFPKGYIYFALAYALVVEMLNIRMRKNKNG
ncbi:MAG: TerC family protein [Flavobacteriales bacterium]|jgi:predicted tellurium resistance membrane protein TerC|nr:TerC family protein [Flavobacteriales bacterium]MBT5932516.1 TerC family protein [Flavobacteriales bacterium]MDA7762908.1 TerC family protein [Crocinitomicaceae bacterium]MDC0302390.1 TerC family protein [bacterium]MDO7614778.1 TerC family protein [Crocinitomicaceae bacterium]